MTDARKQEEWPDNIVADRHEISGKWVIHYLTDAQADKCRKALQSPEHEIITGAKQALGAFDNGFDSYETREYAFNGAQTGKEEGQLYFFWPEDVQKIRAALSPSPDEVVMRRVEVEKAYAGFKNLLDIYQDNFETHFGTILGKAYRKSLSILEAALERKG